MLAEMDLTVDSRQSMYDNALMGILQNCSKLEPFLDTIFSFLARRTDFYILMKHERAKMGFPPGVAENMVHQVPLLILHVPSLHRGGEGQKLEIRGGLHNLHPLYIYYINHISRGEGLGKIVDRGVKCQQSC